MKLEIDLKHLDEIAKAKIKEQEKEIYKLNRKITKLEKTIRDIEKTYQEEVVLSKEIRKDIRDAAYNLTELLKDNNYVDDYCPNCEDY